MCVEKFAHNNPIRTVPHWRRTRWFIHKKWCDLQTRGVPYCPMNAAGGLSRELRLPLASSAAGAGAGDESPGRGNYEQVDETRLFRLATSLLSNVPSVTTAWAHLSDISSD